MIRFALVVASVLGFVLTAALGNMMVPLLRELQRAARGTQPDSDAPDSPVPTMGGLCLMWNVRWHRCCGLCCWWRWPRRPAWPTVPTARCAARPL